MRSPIAKIPKVRFHLKDPSSPTATPINMRLAWGSTFRLKLATGDAVKPKHWNKTRQRVTEGRAVADAGQINARLDSIAHTIVSAFQDWNKARLIPSADMVRKLFELRRPHPSSLVECYNQFVAESGDRLRSATLSVHQTAIKHLQKFDGWKGKQVAFEKIDADWFATFITFLIRVQGLTNASTWKVVKTVRAFLRWAHENGITDNDEYARFTAKKMPGKGDKSDAVYLTGQEVAAIISADLKGDQRLERVRDLFLFQANTGLRYGDVQAIGPDHIQADEQGRPVVRLVTGKNRKALMVPLLPVARQILDSYNGKLPRISNQKQNEYLKELCKVAGIDSQVVMVDYKGSERIEKTHPKYELVSTHTAKRSYVTILRQRGVSIEDLMKVTGNTRQTLERYLLSTNTDAIDSVLNAMELDG